MVELAGRMEQGKKVSEGLKRLRSAVWAQQVREWKSIVDEDRERLEREAVVKLKKRKKRK